MLLSSAAWLRRAAQLGLSLLAAGCTVSPQPTPPPDAPSIALGFLTVSEGMGGVTVTGSAGAVSDGVTIGGLNVTRRSYQEVQVAGDGAFSATFPGFNPDQFRFQAFADDLRSEPLDFVGSDGPGEVFPVARIDCAAFDVDPEHDFGDVAQGMSDEVVVRLQNGCPDPIDVSAAELALTDASFALIVEPNVPNTVAPMGQHLFRVTFQPAAAGDAIEFLLVDFTTGGESETRVVTLFGNGG